MDQNHYRPPHANVDPRNREPGSIPKAVVVGAVIDIGGTILGSTVIAMCYAVGLGMQGLSSDAIAQTLSTADRWSLYGVAVMTLGTVMSVLGGYQCAAIANRNTYLAPGILSVISVASGALMNDGQAALPELLFFSALTVAAILGGASLHLRKLRERPSRPAAKD